MQSHDNQPKQDDESSQLQGEHININGLYECVLDMK